jgi:uncharacterized membrane protein
MNWAHLHLLLNHVPVLGTLFGLALLLYAVLRRNEGLKRVALGACTLVALMALPTYFSGEPAEEVVEHSAGVSEPAIESHEDAALGALAGVEVLGLVALVGLFLSRGGRALPANVARAAVLVAILTAGLMARTANLGGQIRHAEIRADAQPQQGEEAEEAEGDEDEGQ